MGKTILKYSVLIIVSFSLAYILTKDSYLDQEDIDKIGNEIAFNNSLLEKLNKDKIGIEFEYTKECGNDPTVYYYSRAWNAGIENKLKQIGFRKVEFEPNFEDADYNIRLDTFPCITITCIQKQHDFFSTEIQLEMIYSPQLNSVESFLEEVSYLKLKDNDWIKINK